MMMMMIIIVYDVIMRAIVSSFNVNAASPREEVLWHHSWPQSFTLVFDSGSANERIETRWENERGNERSPPPQCISRLSCPVCFVGS